MTKKVAFLLGGGGAALLYATYLILHFTQLQQPPTVNTNSVKPTTPQASVPRERPKPAKTTPVNSGAPVATIDAATADFVRLTERAMQRLPRVAEIRKRVKDFHHTPPEMTEVSEELGAILDSMEKDPRNIDAGAAFFKRCAESEDVMMALRAVCLRNFHFWKPSETLNVPASVARLAHRLPKTP